MQKGLTTNNSLEKSTVPSSVPMIFRLLEIIGCGIEAEVMILQNKNYSLTAHQIIIEVQNEFN